MSSRAPLLICTATCAPGAEQIVAAELATFGVKVGSTPSARVEFKATMRQVYAVTAGIRTATRILVEVDSFGATTFPALDAALGRVDWAPWIDPWRPLSIKVSSFRSELYHESAIAERVLAAAGAPAPKPDDEPGDDAQVLVVRVVADHVRVAIDAAGGSLDRRGWRLEVGKAPLRPTVAATLLAVSGWTLEHPLLDPFCGSGTIVIEAARRAAGMAPCARRRFAFFAWPGFEPGTWASVEGAMATQRAEAADRAHAAIVAADRDAGAIAAARANAERAGVEPQLELSCAAVSATLAAAAAVAEREPEVASGHIVTNPPWGRRMAGGDKRDLGAAFGAACRRLPGWTITAITEHDDFARAAKLDLHRIASVNSGGRRLKIWRGIVPGPGT